jgi:hypothetical protein
VMGFLDVSFQVIGIVGEFVAVYNL